MDTQNKPDFTIEPMYDDDDDYVTCPNCDGDGLDFEGTGDCSYCDGKGVIEA